MINKSKLNLLSSILIFTTLMTMGILNGCSSKSINENNPDELYTDAEEDVKDKRYLQALEKLKTVKNKFPYSNAATKAALRIADVHFYEESYVEAAASYETFQDLHPKFEKADYVCFQIAESYFNQLPDSVDRDLTPATKAIENYQNLEKMYPHSSYVPKAKERTSQALERLARKERYIADFYYRHDMYDSAATRYEKITKKYSGSPVEEYSYMRWADSLLKQDKKDEAKHVYETYLNHFPHGNYKSKAETAVQ